MMNPACRHALEAALQLKQEHGDIRRNTEEFHSIKELAKRFALSFGLDAVKNRDAVASLHREG